MWILECDFKNGDYKFQQLRDEIIKIIESGKIDYNEALPTINEVSDHYKLSKVTVGRAYNHLKKRGIISNIKGKFYVVQEKANRIKILLVFNKLEDNKRNTYEAIQDVFNGTAIIDFQVYYSNYQTFKNIINESLNKYDYYIIMPHFYHDTFIDDNYTLLNKISANKLIFIDRIIPEIKNFKGAVIQDFDADMYLGLEKTKTLLTKYKELRFIMKEHSHHPVETTNAAQRFCDLNILNFSIVDDIVYESITPHVVYIVTTDKDLALIIKKIKNSVYSLGKEVGIISYNETILKEVLNITVFSTNFYQMGKIAAKMVLEQQFEIVKNPFDIIIRDSL